MRADNYIKKDIILERISIIENNLKILKKLGKVSRKNFLQDMVLVGAAESYLRKSLEAVFDIASHIISRIPGEKPKEYKSMAKYLGNKKIVPLGFAEDKLVKMAGYRNRLVHFYWEITSEELYNIITNNIDDLTKYCKYIIKFIKKPKGGLRVE